MICLDVADYCQSCCEFDPDVEHPTQMFVGREIVEQTDTVVRCAHRRRCEIIKRYLKQEEMKTHGTIPSE